MEPRCTRDGGVPTVAKTRLRRNLLVAAAIIVVAVTAATVAPYPSIAQIRGWSDSVGPVFVMLFFLAQVVMTVTPVPRTVFTLSAGVLFGPIIGVAVTITATTVSAVIAFTMVRALGRNAVRARLSHPKVLAVDERLSRRGWMAVASLRLIAIVPFAVVNYCCALSSVRLLPYTAATVAGMLPGTLGVVLLGDALTGRTNPALTAVTIVCLLLGAAGLLIELRRPAATATPAGPPSPKATGTTTRHRLHRFPSLLRPDSSTEPPEHSPRRDLPTMAVTSHPDRDGMPYRRYAAKSPGVIPR